MSNFCNAIRKAMKSQKVFFFSDTSFFFIGFSKGKSVEITRMQKISFNQHDDFIKPERSPVAEHIPDFLASEECRERRTAFLERRPLDPAKNMPYVSIPIR